MTVALMLALCIVPFAAEAGDTFTCELVIDTPVKGQFYFAAYKHSTGALVDVEATARRTWDDAWPGHFIVESENDYVSSRPEREGFAVDLMAQGLYGSAVVFKAPVAGTYSVAVSAQRYYEKATTPVNASLVKGDGTVVASIKNIDQANAEIAFDETVTLAKDEVVFLLIAFAADDEAGRVDMDENGTGGHNVGLKSFVVTLDSVGTGSAGNENQGGTTPNPNPETSDNIVLAVSALALAAAGVVIASNKRR